ncbi:helix-turn-helix domain-containing protein [Ktedonobacter racemifer]|nr:helix-turn-helix domain-containing protein [Ktedonobacter racemifer]
MAHDDQEGVKPLDMVPLSIDGVLYYTSDQAASVLKTTPKYVRVLAVQYKKFPARQLNPKLLAYPKEEIDAYAEKMAHGKPGRPAGAKDRTPRRYTPKGSKQQKQENAA